VSDRAVIHYAEFPNDNPDLHPGAFWRRFGTGAVLAAGEAGVGVGVAVGVAVDDGDDEDPGDIEVLDEIEFEGAVEESVFESDLPPQPAATSDDPFATLVRVMEDVAHAANAGDEAIALLRAIAGAARLDANATPEAHALREYALAWQGILRGESEDFGACGSAMLDEWAADVIARALGGTARADGLKRELRRRGVAAFGLVAEAA